MKRRQSASHISAGLVQRQLVKRSQARVARQQQAATLPISARAVARMTATTATSEDDQTFDFVGLLDRSFNSTTSTTTEQERDAAPAIVPIFLHNALIVPEVLRRFLEVECGICNADPLIVAPATLHGYSRVEFSFSTSSSSGSPSSSNSPNNKGNAAPSSPLSLSQFIDCLPDFNRHLRDRRKTRPSHAEVVSSLEGWGVDHLLLHSFPHIRPGPSFNDKVEGVLFYPRSEHELNVFRERMEARYADKKSGKTRTQGHILDVEVFYGGDFRMKNHLCWDLLADFVEKERQTWERERNLERALRRGYAMSGSCSSTMVSSSTSLTSAPSFIMPGAWESETSLLPCGHTSEKVIERAPGFRIGTYLDPEYKPPGLAYYESSSSSPPPNNAQSLLSRAWFGSPPQHEQQTSTITSALVFVGGSPQGSDRGWQRGLQAREVETSDENVEPEFWRRSSAAAKDRERFVRLKAKWDLLEFKRYRAPKLARAQLFSGRKKEEDPEPTTGKVEDEGFLVVCKEEEQNRGVNRGGGCGGGGGGGGGVGLESLREKKGSWAWIKRLWGNGEEDGKLKIRKEDIGEPDAGMVPKYGNIMKEG
ncbi:hypothetical protein DFH27DRAFT_528721 [Peziza echinospora]|nr:hypothetical protein DFH27DRAFT_528721 [Peziza echinospora]